MTKDQCAHVSPVHAVHSTWLRTNVHMLALFPGTRKKLKRSSSPIFFWASGNKTTLESWYDSSSSMATITNKAVPIIRSGVGYRPKIQVLATAMLQMSSGTNNNDKSNNNHWKIVNLNKVDYRCAYQCWQILINTSYGQFHTSYFL